MYAWEIVNSASKEIFDMFMRHWLKFAEIFIVVKILKRFDLVDFLMCPLEPTSKGTKKHL